MADRAVWFANRLTLSDESLGKPLVLRPWQESIVRDLHKTDDNGVMTVRRCLLLLPRGSGKSQLAATLAIIRLLGLKRTGEHIILAACDRKTAGIIFGKITEILEADPYLSRQVRIYSSAKRIETRQGGNTLQLISSEGFRNLGEAPSLVIIDELLAQKDTRLYDALSGSLGKRTETLLLMISTQGHRRDSLVYREYERACRVRDARLRGEEIDPSYLPVIYESGDLPWDQESTWFHAMPALGDFYSLDFIRSEYRAALESPTELAKFQSYYLNMLVSASNRWVNQEHWDACGKHTFEDSELLGRPSYWGLDLSATSDITALVGVFPWEDGTYRVKCHFWLPEGYAKKRASKDLIPYLDWAKRGLIELTDGNVIDYPHIESRIPAILKQYKVKKVFADPYNATSTVQRLQSLRLPVEFCRQGWQTMSAPIKHTNVLLAKGLLHHNNNPCLNWQAANAVAHRDRQDNLTFDKSLSADKIDGVVSMVMGILAATSDVRRKITVHLDHPPEDGETDQRV